MPLVAAYLAPLRRGEPVSEGRTTPRHAAPGTKDQCYTSRQAAFLFLRRPAELIASEQDDLARMQAQDGVLATIYAMAQDFAAMLRQRTAEHLDAWLDRAGTSECPELQRFANGIRRDYAAVQAGLSMEWSQGPVEGHATRLKLVKRQMYGRAKLDLLRQRVLNAA